MMVKTIYIHTLNGIKDLIFEQYRNEDNGRYRSVYFYCGMPNNSFSLTTIVEKVRGAKATT